METSDLYRRSWSVKELALQYFPNSSPKCAVAQLRVWIMHSSDFSTALTQAGWRRYQKIYTPRQVQIIVNHLGEP